MGKKRSAFDTNLPELIKFCEANGYEYERPDPYQFRIYGATHVIDIWPSRMTYHRVKGEVIKAHEPYPRGELDFHFNEAQVKKLIETGEL